MCPAGGSSGGQSQDAVLLPDLVPASGSIWVVVSCWWSGGFRRRGLALGCLRCEVDAELIQTLPNLAQFCFELAVISVTGEKWALGHCGAS